jgi:CubicO group peptidase (beta-lactamase class C family)
MRCLVATAVVIAASVPGDIRSAGKQAAVDVPASAAVDVGVIATTIREYLRQTGVPGAAVAVTSGDQVLLAEGYGHTSSGEPVTAHTPMAVGSISKSFTALAVMQLVEAGRVELDAPVRRYLPEFNMADSRVDQVTVRHLLNQTSGLSDRTFPAFSRPQPRSLRELVAGMHAARLASTPGSQWEYHNPNYQVAARLVEVVSGRPFAAYLRERVFDPLGMHDSSAIEAADELPPRARGHVKILGLPVAVPEPRAFGGGSGGVLSSAHDMAAWLIAHHDQGRDPGGAAILTSASITTMRTPTAASRSYGLGWFVGATPWGTPSVWHSGDLFTSTAQQILLTRAGYGVAVMANTGLAYGDAQAIAHRIAALLEGQAVPPAAGWAYVVLDALFLALAAGALLLAVRGVRLSHRRRSGRVRRSIAVARLLPLLTPLVLLVTIHRVMEALYRGRDVAWIQVPYLFPTFLLLLITVTAGCLIVFMARLAPLLRPVPKPGATS